jgi:hypothetical protein
MACRQAAGVDALPERCQAAERIGDVTAAGQQRADEGACGCSQDCLGSRQVDAGLAQPGEQAGLPADTDGAAAAEDDSACW